MSRGRQKLPLRSVQPAGCNVFNAGRTVWWCLINGLTEVFIRLANRRFTVGFHSKKDSQECLFL